jgi:hypothetical protein
MMLASPIWAAKKNGFVLDGALIPTKEIRPGGPPRDGIPAILRPRFISASEANYLQPETRVLGHSNGTIAKAYPVPILNWHEVVNDSLVDQRLLVTYCPLCGTGMAFEVDSNDLFGVSGLLYNSDVLLYDTATESLWSQIMGQAISGPRRGERLRQVTLRHTTWSQWQERHPDTVVLAPPSGSAADYQANPYVGYEKTRRLFFPVSSKSRAFHPKAQVLGLVIAEQAHAYALSELAAAGNLVEETIGATSFRIHHDPASDSAWVEAKRTGSNELFKEVPSVMSYWFAWYAFHPKTAIFRASTGTIAR